MIGEFIYSSISGAPAGLGIDKATGRAALILLTAASLQLMYMFSSGCVNFIHPLRHSGLYASLWFLLHIPAVAALTLAGDAGAVMITQNTEVPQGVRWFFAAGVGIGVLCIALLATLEDEKDNCILVMRKVSSGCLTLSSIDTSQTFVCNCFLCVPASSSCSPLCCRRYYNISALDR